MAVSVSKPNIQNLLIGAGVILLVVAGFYYFRSKGVEESSVAVSPEEIIVQEEGAVKKTGDVVQPLTEEEIKELRNEVDGVLSTGGDVTTLKDVVGSGATGEAKRAFSDGKFYHKISVTGLRPPEKGYFFEGWLEKDGDFFSTGRVEVDLNGNGSLYYTMSVDKSDYSKVVVTLEPEDGDPTPAAHILEGEF